MSRLWVTRAILGLLSLGCAPFLHGAQAVSMQSENFWGGCYVDGVSQDLDPNRWR